MSPWSAAADWMRLILPSFSAGETNWAHKFRLNWTKIFQKNRDLRKSIGRDDGRKRLTDWEEEHYKLPEVKGPRTKTSKTTPPTVFDVQVVEAENKKICEMNESLKTENEELQQKIDTLQERPSPHTQTVQRRREMARNKTISSQKETIRTLEKKSEKLSGKLAHEKKSKRSLTTEFQQFSKIAKLADDSTKSWTETYTTSLENEIEELQHTLRKQKETIDHLLGENESLSQELPSFERQTR